MGTLNLSSLGLVLKEVVNLGSGTVVSDDLETLVVHVEDQVHAHDGKTDESNVTQLL